MFRNGKSFPIIETMVDLYPLPPYPSPIVLSSRIYFVLAYYFHCLDFFVLFSYYELMFFSFAENLWHSFQIDGQIIAASKDPEDTEPQGKKNDRQIYIDITTSFTLLIGIFFPSVTGKHCVKSCRIIYGDLRARVHGYEVLAVISRCRASKGAIYFVVV